MHRRNGPLPPEEAKHYASAVWKDDPQLPQLLAELAENQHSGPVEKEFKDICWPKQKIILTKPSEEKERTLCRTFFLAAESGFSIKVICSLQKKNSWRGVDEASELPYSEGQQEALIACHYNLAVAQQGLGQSKEALSCIT